MEGADADEVEEIEDSRQKLQSFASEEYSNVARVRRQHRLNLGAVMRAAMLRSDYCTAAGAVGALLACQPEGIHTANTAAAVGGTFQLLVEVMWNALEVLRQHTVAHEQVKRAMRKVAAVLLHETGMRQAAQIELAVAHWNLCRPEEAAQGLALLSHELTRHSSRPNASFTYHMATLAAYMKHRAWMEQALGITNAAAAAAQLSRPRSSSSSSSADQQQQRAKELLGPLQLPLQPRREAAAGAAAAVAPGGAASSSNGSSQADLDEVIKQLQRALDVFPAASLPSLLLCHSLVLSDRPAEAAEAARAAVDASGRSPAALSLLALLLQQQLPPAGTAAATATAAAGSVDGAAATDAAAATAGGSDAIVHEYVALCLEVVAGDPWALGAVQGLVQQSGHCSSCAASAVQGILAHLDAAALEEEEAAAAAAEADDGGEASGNATAAATCALSQLWVLLSLLLVQLAAEAATDSSNMAAAAAANSRPAAGSATAAGSSAASAGAGSPQQLWRALQSSFAERQLWWEAAGIADLAELQALLDCTQQLHHHTGEQVSEQTFYFEHEDSIEELVDLLQEWPQQCLQQDGSTDGQQQQLLEQLGLPPLAAAETSSQDQQQQQQQQGDAFYDGGDPPPSWGQLQQLLCCKATVLTFVLGPFNAYSWLALQAAGAAAMLEGASISAAQVGRLTLPELDGLLLQPVASLDSLDASAVGARQALLDALQLAVRLSASPSDPGQPEQQQHQAAQQAPAGTRRVLGVPTVEFGALLDLPDAWWAAFPHKRRRQRQQQQQQQHSQQQ